MLAAVNLLVEVDAAESADGRKQPECMEYPVKLNLILI
jgi:hypothetical protein